MALITRHDESGTRSDRAKAADDKLIGTFIGQEKAGAVVKTMAMIIARIIAVAPNDDVRICDLVVERDALEWAFEVIFHDNAHCIKHIPQK